MEQLGARPRGPGRREGPRADHLPRGGLPAGPALDERARRRVHRVPRHPALARRRCCARRAGRRPRVALLHGGMDGDEREQLRLAFQADPTEHPVRILLATDAASEGIDLQRHCHRLVNYDIPFNPNRLEQRIGRIDRYGQRDRSRHPPLRRHRLGATPSTPSRRTWSSSPGWRGRSSRCAADLGSVNAVLADAVQRRMLGEQVDPATSTAADAGPRPGRARVDTRRAASRSAGCASSSTRRSPSWASPRRRCAGSWTPPWSWPGSARCARTSTTGASTTGCSTSRR